MSLKSVYLPNPNIESDVVRITGDEHRHLVVGRVEPGEQIEIFDGNGHVWTARIEDVGRKMATARIEASRIAARPAAELILGQSLIRNAAFELAVEKAVELGVTRIIPIIAARSNVRAGERHDRLERIVIEAAKQSKRYYLPQVMPPMDFEAVLSVKATSRIVFAERRGGTLKSALTGFPALYLIGPEGGWTDHELESARSAGFHLVSFGSGILKSETAAIAASAVIQFCCTDETNPIH
jgi:16S rRNA (uracil1498-N3)-methyltransferase